MSNIFFWRWISLAFIFLCFTICTFAQGSSNQGTEFYTAYIDHVDGAAGNPDALGNGSQMELYITADINTSVTVEVADGSFSNSYQVKAKDILTVDIPPGAFIGKQGQFLKGIHITSLKPIAVYAHIFAQNVSGATLLLPVNTLGKDYLSINYKQISNSNNGTRGNEGVPSYSTFAVIATEDNTTVEITPSQPLLNGILANQPFTLNLKKGEVYQGLSATDLTGTRIRSIASTAGTCKKIAVFSGSSKISIGCQGDKGSSDNLFQQVYPMAVWGKNYITAPLKERNYDILRIVLSSSDTKVTVNGAAPQGGLVNGLYYEFTSTTPNVITADKPIQVAQYAVTQGEGLNCQLIASDIGDPEMIYLTPIEQTLDHVTLNSTSNYLIQNNSINVIIKTAAVPTFSLDGLPYTQFSQVPNSIYSYAQISVNAGVHNIKASDGFNAIAYGFGGKESYGYAAGTNLKNLNEFISLLNPADRSLQANGCAGTHYKLQLTLPFQTNKITWNFKDGTAPVIMNNPVPTGSIIKDSKVLYTYEYPVDEVYNDGDYTVVATVFNPIADECGSNEDVQFDFNISAPPIVKFNYAHGCLGENVQFTDQSTSGTRQIKTWKWDFGDGTSDVIQNPVHEYSQPGDYLVTLFITNENGCGAAADPLKIHISKPPVASFNYSLPGCAGQDVTFTDNSTSAEGNIISWQWDFGDGTPVETLTSKNPFNHTYSSPGDYLVKLTVTNSNGCTSKIAPLPVNVYPVPVVDFLLPDACEDDFAQFTDQSTIADATESDFTYEWNFGDPNATAGNLNISHEKNPRHHFLAGNYQVTLQVISKNGCSFTSASKLLTVNGSKPKAVVYVQNPMSLCSAQEVFFENRSSVNFGEITRLEVTYDNSDPSTTVVYEHPALGLQLRHKYPLFTTGTRSVTLRAIAYSGTSCSDIAEIPIILKASPKIAFDQTPVFCVESPPYQLQPKLDGPAGSGVFSGIGVTADGLFNPAVSGPGVFDIRYIYTTANTCADTVLQQVKVDASPIVSLGQDFTMLEGTKHVLKPIVNDNKLSYKWTPATGLDHDDIANPVASPAQDVTYQVVVTSQHGCEAMATVSVKVLKFLIVPNVFTPNGDGVNDIWNVKYLESYPNNKVDVYNRYGEKVYSSIGYSVPWDGKYNGSYLPPGTYYYIIDPKNGREVIAGNVTIIR